MRTFRHRTTYMIVKWTNTNSLRWIYGYIVLTSVPLWTDSIQRWSYVPFTVGSFWTWTSITSHLQMAVYTCHWRRYIEDLQTLVWKVVVARLWNVEGNSGSDLGSSGWSGIRPPFLDVRTLSDVAYMDTIMALCASKNGDVVLSTLCYHLLIWFQKTLFPVTFQY